ncbi:MAG: phosphoribosylamine--glycine ligase [Bacillota bacterium]
MKVLIVGSGGREHAIAWAVSRSSRVEQIYAAPGNAGIAEIAECVPIQANQVRALAEFAHDKGIDLTVVGPELPLAMGIVDGFAARGLKCFGPTAAAARIESSKIWAKQFMKRHGIPTAAFQWFDSIEPALSYVRAQKGGVVIKADGLAAGKGAVVVGDSGEAEQVLKAFMEKRALGDAGARVVIEERLQGPEVSVMALCDGERVVPLAPAQDYKRAYDCDQGPNTGGMGAYSPVPLLDTVTMERIYSQILVPTVRGLKSEGIEYVGVLYAGLMLTDEGPKVLEFNCRFGDPETQVVLPRLESDLVSLLEACVDRRLGSVPVKWSPSACVCVVVASQGYPGEYSKGMPITGMEEAKKTEGVMLFHAGTAVENGRVVTAGGRVMGVTAVDTDIGRARAKAYEAVSKIKFGGMFYRRDIAAKH